MKNDQREEGSRANSAQQKEIWPKIILGSVGCVSILCALVGLAIGYQYISPYFGPRITVIFEPGVPQDIKIGSSDLQTATRILTERCRLLGVSSASFTVSDNRQIVGQIPGNEDVDKLLENIKAVGLLEIVDFGNKPVAEGKKIITDFDYKYMPQTEERKWHTVMTNNEIQAVNVTTDSAGGPAISLTFTPNGTKIFADYTTNNVDKYLGIVLDKVVLSAPRVNTPITDGSAIIEGGFTTDEANALAVSLKVKDPLPFPLKVIQVSSNSK